MGCRGCWIRERACRAGTTTAPPATAPPTTVAIVAPGSAQITVDRTIGVGNHVKKRIIVSVSGLTGAPGDSARLATMLEQLIVNPAQRLTLGQAGPIRGQQLCDPARQIEAMAAALNSPTGVRS